MNSKNLYVVVHHRSDPNQPWVNSWFDDDRLEAIQQNECLHSHIYCMNKQLLFKVKSIRSVPLAGTPDPFW